MGGVINRKTARAKVRTLGLSMPRPFSIEALCAHVGQRRGRPVRLVELDLSTAAAACGLWIATDTADYICVDRLTSKPLRVHTVLHELCHILCGHQGVLGAAEITQFRLLDPALIRRVLARSAYDRAEEREAELLASEIGSRIDPIDLDTSTDTSTRRVLDGLSDVLGGGA